ncbi:MAG: hypothetical protein ACSHYA_20380 [Opitutaceae bacterium]
MNEIGIKLDWNSEGVGCFDPIQLIARLRLEFPETETKECDHLLNTCKAIAELGGNEITPALKSAVKDLHERGPAIQFEIPVSAQKKAKGIAERYWMRVSSEEPFPGEFENRFMKFLLSLHLQNIEIVKS